MGADRAVLPPRTEKEITTGPAQKDNRTSRYKKPVVRKQIVSKEKPVTKPFPIGGSLRTHYQAWKSLMDDSWVLQSVQARVEPCTSSTLRCPPRATNVSREGEVARPRGFRPSSEEGNRTHLECRVFQPTFRSPEEGRWLASNYKPKEVEFTCI